MITDIVLSCVLSIVTPIIEKMPDINMSDYMFSGSAFNVVKKWVDGVMYFLPMDTVGTILSFILVLWCFRIVISVLKTLWGILPIA